MTTINIPRFGGGHGYLASSIRPLPLLIRYGVPVERCALLRRLVPVSEPCFTLWQCLGVSAVLKLGFSGSEQEDTLLAK